MGTNKRKQSIILYGDQIKIIEDFSDEVVGRLFRALLEFAQNGVIPPVEDIVVHTAFKMFKIQIDIDSEKYEEQCRKNAENQKKRWEKEKLKKNTNVYERIPTDTKHTDNDNDNDNDNDIIDTPKVVSDNNIEKKEDKSSKKKVFRKPTPEEVDEYCKKMTAEGKQCYNFTGQQFVDFYESKGWVIGKSPMKDWKAACRTWAAHKGRTSTSQLALGHILDYDPNKEIKERGITSENFWSK